MVSLGCNQEHDTVAARAETMVDEWLDSAKPAADPYSGSDPGGRSAVVLFGIGESGLDAWREAQCHLRTTA